MAMATLALCVRALTPARGACCCPPPPPQVRDVFRLARENAPAVIFIDEVDAIATKRFDAQTGADREVQRILMELLTQMDGFDQSVNVKVIMCTNRADTLDPALLRPGRLDRKIEFPQPGRREKRLIFQVRMHAHAPRRTTPHHPGSAPALMTSTYLRSSLNTLMTHLYHQMLSQDTPRTPANVPRPCQASASRRPHLRPPFPPCACVLTLVRRCSPPR